MEKIDSESKSLIEYKRVSKNEKNGLLEMIKNKIHRYIQDREDQDSKALPGDVKLLDIKRVATSVAQAESDTRNLFCKVLLCGSEGTQCGFIQFNEYRKSLISWIQRPATKKSAEN